MAVIAAGLSGAIALLALLLAALLWHGRTPAIAAATWLSLLLLAVAALELASGPIAAALPPRVARPLALAGTLNLALIWLTGHALLIDGFVPRRRHWLVAALLWAGPLSVWAGLNHSGLDVAASVLPFLMLAHLAWLALAGRGDDLVPGRRNFRLAVPALLMLAALVSVLSEQIDDPVLADLLRTALSGLPAMLLLAWWLLRADAGVLGFAPTPALLPPAAPAIDPRDADLARRLDAAMTTGRLWQREGLSIDQLAAHLNTPPHRLRALINGGLGQRNFAHFINNYRIKATQAALADPTRGRETILAIAYEAGFASLATFNRVFRDQVGETPTDHRARMLRDLENRGEFSIADEKPAAESA